jgi:hypothetical protein
MKVNERDLGVNPTGSVDDTTQINGHSNHDQCAPTEYVTEEMYAWLLLCHQKITLMVVLVCTVCEKYVYCL